MKKILLTSDGSSGCYIKGEKIRVFLSHIMHYASNPKGGTYLTFFHGSNICVTETPEEVDALIETASQQS